MTDPDFLHKGDHVHLGPGITAERLTNPAIELEALPQIDVIILSHFHEDHFDKLVQNSPVLKGVPIVTTSQAAEELSKLGFLSSFALDRWETALIAKGDAKLLVTATPAQHAPTGLLEFVLPETMGSLVRFVWHSDVSQAELDTKSIEEVASNTVYKLYISGDTLMFADLEHIPRRFPEIDCGLIHLGATTIGLGMFMVTMDAEQGVKCVKLIRPKTAIPIVSLTLFIGSVTRCACLLMTISAPQHTNDYDVFASKGSLAAFKEVAEREGLHKEVEIVYLEHGDSYTFNTHKI